MKQTVSKFWKSIRRNPVINGFILATVAQISHDFLAKQIDWTNIIGYLSLVLIGVATREFTVPVSEHENLKGKVSEAILEGSLKRYEGDVND